MGFKSGSEVCYLENQIFPKQVKTWCLTWTSTQGAIQPTHPGRAGVGAPRCTHIW